MEKKPKMSLSQIAQAADPVSLGDTCGTGFISISACSPSVRSYTGSFNVFEATLNFAPTAQAQGNLTVAPSDQSALADGLSGGEDLAWILLEAVVPLGLDLLVFGALYLLGWQPGESTR
jgi:hypothetical protein